MLPSEGMSGGSEEAKQAGRGVLFIAFAKVYFMFAGALIEFSLPNILTTATFGAYKVVVSAISPLNSVLITGTVQAVSRFTVQRPERAKAVQRAGLRLAAFVGIPLAVGFVLLAKLGVLARGFQDAAKTGPIMLAGLIVAGYAVYAVFVGTANGRKHFGKQAGLDITMATMRALGIVGLTVAGFGLYGAISGWVMAAGAILVVAVLVVGLPGRATEHERPQPMRPLMSFFSKVAVYLLLFNLIMWIDTYLLKHLSTDWFADNHAQMTATLAKFQPTWAVQFAHAVEPSQLADSQVGYYGAVQNLARLSYQAIIAATFVIFPLVSRTTFEQDEAATRRYIATTLRYSLIFASAIGVVLAANPRPILDIPYSASFVHNGGPALVALGLGSVAFAIFAIVGTILNGAGLTRQATIVAFVTLAIAAAANAFAIPRFEPGQELLLACGVATGASMVAGTALGGWFLHRHLGAFLPFSCVVRVLVAGGAAMGVARFLPFVSPLMTLVEACVVGLVFLLTLVVTRELTGADLRAVTGVLSRKKGNS